MGRLLKTENVRGRAVFVVDEGCGHSLPSWYFAFAAQAAVFQNRLAAVTTVAERLPVAFVPEQLVVALVGADMIHAGCRDQVTASQMLLAEWIAT